jgi:hypothetical protein
MKQKYIYKPPLLFNHNKFIFPSPKDNKLTQICKSVL